MPELGTDGFGGLYDDVRALGGLPAAVQDALSRTGSELTAADVGLPTEIRQGFPAYARVEAGRRFSQVYMAKEERLFLFDFWDQGVLLANGRSPSLGDLARSVHAWITDGLDTSEVERRFPFVRASPRAKAFEQGLEVQERWRGLMAREPNPPAIPLKPFLELAFKEPVLRNLFPFTSMMTLCFSRCTGYPYTRDCPAVTPIGDGRYKVTRMDFTPIGEGSEKEALRLVLANLPPNCGPAQKGTATDLEAH